MNTSVLNIKVSCLTNCDGVIPKDVNLLTWLTSDKYRSQVENLRSIQDEKLQKDIKLTLPCITPSGRFSYRDTEHLIEHTGFLAFDIDKQDNRNISFVGLREEISHIKNVAYCGLSCRGQGLWGLIPIPKCSPEEHKQRFNALAKDFKAFDLVLDPICGDITRLRIYSYDPDAYFNHNAILYTKILKPQPKQSTRPAYSDTREKVESIISTLRVDLTENYQTWFKIGCSLADEFGEGGRGYFHSVSRFHPGYSPDKTDRMFDDILKHDYDKVCIGWLFNLLKDYGIRIKELPEPEQTIQHVTTLPKVERVVKIKMGPWSSEIEELEQFFKAVKLPAGRVRLDQCNMITDLSLFLNSHLSIAKAQNGNSRYLPYLERMRQLKQFLN